MMGVEQELLDRGVAGRGVKSLRLILILVNVSHARQEPVRAGERGFGLAFLSGLGS